MNDVERGTSLANPVCPGRAHPAMNRYAGNRMRCWVCEHEHFQLVKESSLPRQLDSQAFQITDARYGVTADIYRCAACGFRQCSGLDDVLKFYEDMHDEEYEDTRLWRAIQARKLLEIIATHLPQGRLLDIGAGSGILVEEALKMGYAAQGIEPSQWLWQKAVDRRLLVHHGVLPHEGVSAPVDIVCLIDVIEHVPDPLGLLSQARRILSDHGIGVLVTPDVASFAARTLRSKWWHYRIAHIGYFNRETIALALSKTGFEPIAIYRPSWYFPLDYLLRRLLAYASVTVPASVAACARPITIPLNLHDSLLVVFRKVLQ